MPEQADDEVSSFKVQAEGHEGVPLVLPLESDVGKETDVVADDTPLSFVVLDAPVKVVDCLWRVV